MELMDMLLHRRSIRKYTEEPIPEEKLQAIVQAGLLSFAGKGLNPWELIVVRDKAMLKQMSGCRTGCGSMLDGADAAIVVLGEAEKSDTIVEDCSIVMAYMHLMADTLGVGSCWLQGRLRFAEDGSSTEEYLRERLGYPENRKLEAVLVLGMPAQQPEAHKLEALQYDKVHKEVY
ncbi:MAG: nitroreductase family protein [Eubacteriales bacterium]|nr:nitroreductase family protein [Eubacteriales bacterium]